MASPQNRGQNNDKLKLLTELVRMLLQEWRWKNLRLCKKGYLSYYLRRIYRYFSKEAFQLLFIRLSFRNIIRYLIMYICNSCNQF